MSRIRSVHPGLWTDANFMEVSPLAGLLFIALGNFADDNGVFVWNEQQLKAKIFPSRRIVFKRLLGELQAQKMIEPYEVNGVQYGVIRNFKQWQKPKNPVAKYPEKASDCHSEVDCKLSASRPLVGCSLSAGSVLVDCSPEKDNKNSKLQKKLPLGGGRGGEGGRGKDISPQTPQEIIQPNKGEVIPINANARLFNQGLTILCSSTGKSKKECRSIIGKWLRDTNGNAEMVMSAIEKGSQARSPIPYASKIIQNFVLMPDKSQLPRKTNKERLTEEMGLCRNVAEFEATFGSGGPTLEQLEDFDPKARWGSF